MRLWSVGSWLRGLRYRWEPWRQWIHHICEKLRLLQGTNIAGGLGFDLWRAQSAGEPYHLTALAGVRGLVKVWSAQGVTAYVHESEILWTSRLLGTNYRSAKKATNPLWLDTVRYGRRIQS